MLHTSVVEDASSALPAHVAIIMDGNGRWAQQKGKLRTFGHKAGVEAVRAVVRFAREKGISTLTLFAFSSENWKRPKDEVSVLMDLFNLVLNKEAKRLHKNGVRLRVLGDTSAFGAKLVDKIQQAEAMTATNSAMTLCICANYGGRWDVLQAARKMAQAVIEDKLSLEQFSEGVFDDHTVTAGLPPLDLLIRTGGEHRISNFLLWQAAYAELYFTDVLWPDFNEAHFQDAINDYTRRQRRFGLTGEQVEASAC
jgi:undecaprenyl diphosphate synthase